MTQIESDEAAVEAPVTEHPAPGAETLDSPVEVTAGQATAKSRAANVHGALSIETFCSAGPLSHTHEDADGFSEWLGRWYPSNFRYRDGGVKIWAYTEPHDNWQDTYGMDAVLCAWHSGHGGMAADGVFFVPLGAPWAGDDCTVTSEQMRLGDERARYVFWSTCESLRVLGGHSPSRTWSTANQGLRMIFGFETISWDFPDYGRKFGEHWNSGKSLSASWLQASWDLAHDQAPSVSANGATKEEAQDRLWNERNFQWAQASRAWWWWAWYNVQASSVRAAIHVVPSQPQIPVLARAGSRSLSSLGQRFGLGATRSTRYGAGVNLQADGRRVHVRDDGTLSAQLAEPNRGNHRQLGRQEVLRAAQDAVGVYGLDADGPLVVDRVVEITEAGGTDTGDGTREGPFVTATMVQFRQFVSGLPIITPSAGAVRVTVDNDGTVTTIEQNTRLVEGLSEHPQSATPAPTASGRAVDDGPADPAAALARGLDRTLRALMLRGTAPIGYSVVPGSSEIGYDIQGSTAVLVAREAVEMEFEGGYRKRYFVTAPLYA
ncbi:DUF6345 domain-containing protein [Kineococcus indalonis]|uniref:DUF6345 domain-containing protein n=1 Tax=Kineococcus indalonis TaxID=2696566 RepID=UPI00141297B3|nr:DUF6345 domain-containing protein [Kineococcus indalonis]NAZ84775.1 hypothetical protein [Kineococcus indalonis]